MRLGLSSWTYTWAVGVPGHAPEHPLQAGDLLDRAARQGVRLVQFADNLPLGQLTPGQLIALERQVASQRLAVEVGTQGIRLDNLRTYLRLAQRFSSPILRVVVDTANAHPSENQVVGALREVCGEFVRAHVCLAIENHDRFPARILARIVERVGSQAVGICLDTANSFGALEGPERVVEILGPLTVNLHLKDFVVQRAPHGLGFAIEGRPAGQGQLRIPWLLDELRRMGRDPNAILELWTPPESMLSATIAKEEAWAKSSIAYLRQLIPT